MDVRRSAAAGLGVLVFCAVVALAARNRKSPDAASWGSWPEWSTRGLVVLVVVGAALVALALLVRTYRTLGRAAETSLLGGFGLLAVAALVTAVATVVLYVAID